MIKPEPAHQARLQTIQAASAEEFKQWLKVSDFNDPNYIAPEVLATLVRIRFREAQGLHEVAAKALHDRVWKRITGMIGDHPEWIPAVKKENQPEFVDDAAQEFWKEFLKDDSEHPEEHIFAEVRFGPYLEGCVKDYIKHLYADKNSAVADTDVAPVEIEKGEDGTGETTSIIDNAPDEQGENWLEELLAKDQVEVILKGLPAKERLALILRGKFGYEWDIVAHNLGVSKPTAHKIYKQGKERVLRSQQ